MDSCCNKGYLSQEMVKKLKGVLYFVFFINAGMFAVEVTTGILSHSSSLLADSLDMLGDAFVYGLSLFVLAKHHTIQAKASLIKGLMMLVFSLYVFWEAFQKMIHPLVPQAQTISAIGLLALVANALCYFTLTKHKDENINMESSWLCSRNDMVGNLGVIAAGILVGTFDSMWPDIVIGLGIAGMALYFSAKLIKESLRHLS